MKGIYASQAAMTSRDAAVNPLASLTGKGDSGKDFSCCIFPEVILSPFGLAFSRKRPWRGSSGATRESMATDETILASQLRAFARFT